MEASRDDRSTPTLDEMSSDARKALIRQKWARHPPPVLRANSTYDTDWRFGLGNPSNGLQATIKDRPALDSVVQLPHRVLKPDWPLWYEREITTGSAGWLYVDADDGAQVFRGGRPVFTLSYGAFYRWPGESIDTWSADERTITIRVLNNAMRGGLRSVRWFSGLNAYPDILYQRWQRAQLRRLVYEADAVDSLSNHQMVALISAFDDPSKETVQQADNVLGGILKYPILPAAKETSHPEFGFTAWGDSQNGLETFERLVSRMIEDPAAFSIGLGDLVGDGSDEEQWMAFTIALQPLLKKMPVYPVAGNHDYDGYYDDLIPHLYYKYTRAEWKGIRPYFSWQYGGAYFLALDPNRTFPLAFDDEQAAWMMGEMNSDAWRQANWRFVLLHQPPYAQGWPGYHGDAFVREMVDSLAAPKKIDFVLTGHTHDYERLTKTYGDQKTHFFVLGGAGGGLEPAESSEHPVMDRVIKAHHFARFAVTPNRVSVRIIGLDGEELDVLEIDR